MSRGGGFVRDCAMTCPICSGALVEERRKGLALDVCQVCGSIFFDAGELDASASTFGEAEDRFVRWVRPREECIVCGEEVGEIDEHCDVPMHLDCPRCHAEFYKIRTRTSRLEYCDGCGGFLLEPEMVKRLAARVAQPDPPPAPPPPPPMSPLEQFVDRVSQLLFGSG